MNEEIKAQWVAALRSGEYRQGTGVLHKIAPKPDDPDTFCCLGVLCDLAVKAGVNIPVVHKTAFAPGPGLVAAYDNFEDFPPPKVRQWAGLGTSDPTVWTTDDAGNSVEMSLSYLNDNGASFEDIASIIETNM